MKKLTDNHRAFSIFMFATVCIFYLFFALYDGAVICVDSPSYIGMSIAREPAYPIFLAFLRSMFTKIDPDLYLTVAAILQSMLAAFCAWSFAAYVTREYKISKLFSLLVLYTPPEVSLLCRFAAKRSSMYSNSILTEGITIPCYFLFFRYLIEFCLHRRKKSFLSCWALALLLISTRKQMSITLFMLILSILYCFFQDKHYFKGLVLSFSCAASILLGTFCIDMGYNYVLRGDFTRHSGDGSILQWSSPSAVRACPPSFLLLY